MKHSMHWLHRGYMPLYIGACFDEETFWKTVKKSLDAEDVRRVPYFSSKTGATTQILPDCYGKQRQSAAIICFHGKEHTKTSISTLAGLIAHEATHVKQFMCEDVGEKLISPEMEAYTVQAIVCQTMNAYINEFKPKLKAD